MEKYMKFTMFEKETTDKKYQENPYRAVNFRKDKDGNLQGEDIREGITAIISVKISEPQFEGHQSFRDPLARALSSREQPKRGIRRMGNGVLRRRIRPRRVSAGRGRKL